MRQTIFGLMVMSLILTAYPKQSFSTVEQATAHYLRGYSQFKARRYAPAISSFKKAYRLLPGHPHFNCRRTEFLNYIASSQERLGQRGNAMRTFYKSAYKTGCREASKAHLKSYAAKRYRSLYYQLTCSISFTSTPPKARLIMITTQGERQIGRAPFKKTYSPGKYRFKIRMYEYKTQYYDINLRSGMHVTKNFKLVKGEDIVNRTEKVDIAPPPPVVGSSPAEKRKAKNNEGNFEISPQKPIPRRRLRLAVKNQGEPEERGLGGALNTGGIKRAKAGPPIYKQTWFWVTIGAAAVGGVAVAVLIPKEQQVLITKGTLWK